MAEERWRKSVGPAEVVKLSVGPMDNNIYFISVGPEAILIDGSNEADAILSELGDRGLVAVLQTHGHGDHIVALAEIVEKTGAPVYSHPGDQDRMPVPTQELNEGDAHSVDGVTLRVLHTPGHTPGSVCFLLESGGETHLFAGDTLFPGGPGNTFGSADDFKTIMSSLDAKLFTLPDDTHVYPGHGSDTTIGTERGSVEEWRARGW